MRQTDMGDLMKQAARMRKDVDRVHAQMKDRYVEASVADGLVRVTLNGAQELVKVEIAPEALKPANEGEPDLELLEDLITAAVNQGLEESKKLLNDEVNKVTGGLGGALTGLF